MKVYNLDGKAVTVDKEQMQIVLDAGWSKTKPEVEKEVEPEVEKEVEPEVEEPELPKLKKIRKILKKK